MTTKINARELAQSGQTLLTNRQAEARASGLQNLITDLSDVNYTVEQLRIAVSLIEELISQEAAETTKDEWIEIFNAIRFDGFSLEKCWYTFAKCKFSRKDILILCAIVFNRGTMLPKIALRSSAAGKTLVEQLEAKRAVGGFRLGWLTFMFPLIFDTLSQNFPNYNRFIQFTQNLKFKNIDFADTNETGDLNPRFAILNWACYVPEIEQDAYRAFQHKLHDVFNGNKKDKLPFDKKFYELNYNSPLKPYKQLTGTQANFIKSADFANKFGTLLHNYILQMTNKVIDVGQFGSGAPAPSGGNNNNNNNNNGGNGGRPTPGSRPQGSNTTPKTQASTKMTQASNFATTDYFPDEKPLSQSELQAVQKAYQKLTDTELNVFMNSTALATIGAIISEDPSGFLENVMAMQADNRKELARYYNLFKRYPRLDDDGAVIFDPASIASKAPVVKPSTQTIEFSES